MKTFGIRRAAVLTLCLALGTPAVVFGQDVLARAKDFYASAAYEEALQLLESLKDKPASAEASAYQVFCLVALNRRDEARTAVETIVRTNPLYRPAEAQVSPRIRAFFDDVRKPLLPDAARQSYARGKAAYDEKNWAAALLEFDRTMTLLEEIGPSDSGSADLKTLATGFRDLAKTALLPPPAPPPVAPTAAPAPPPEPIVYGAGSETVMRPIPISKPLPEWRPNPVEARMVFEGQVELVIAEDGHVLSATMAKGIHPNYDAKLLQAVKTWTFRPAMKDGVAVRYRYTVDVKLGK